MDTSSYYGHKIIFNNNEWFFVHTGKLVSETYKTMFCGVCKSKATTEGHDACLGTLKGVMNACCGHGNNNEAYVQLLDGSILRGDLAITFIEKLKKEG